MLVTVKGLVIRSLKYGESSLIFDLYTQEYGYASFIVGGVRKPKARMPASLFQLMNWIEVVAYVKDPSQLSRVKETRLVLNYKQIPFDVQKRGVGMFITEIVQKTIKEKEANEQLYQFLWKTFLYLDESDASISNVHIVFLLHLSGYLGFLPHSSSDPSTSFFNLLTGSFEQVRHPIYSLDQDTSNLLAQCLEKDVENAHTLRLARAQRKDLVQSLITFYKLHLERMPDIQTHQILAQVLEG